ncbi:MAG: hypothetical protein MUO40_11270 [Anaerolineaceae bacterium]|nr:hypothetical protein [Anaerolineaceae bacterium]
MRLPPKKESQNRSSKRIGSLDIRLSESDPGGVIGVLQKFSRFGWDLLGVLLVAVSLILLLGCFGITRGGLITPLVTFLKRWLGLGRFLFTFSLTFLGVIIIRWSNKSPKKVHLGRVIFFEIALVLGLGVLSFVSGTEISKAESGNNLGGIIGWGISEFFSVFFGRVGSLVVLIILITIFAGMGFNLFSRLENWLKKEVGEENENSPLEPIIDFARSGKLYEKDKPTTAGKNKSETPSPYIPPEFRKSFETPKRIDKKPDNPPERDNLLPPITLLEEEKSHNPDKQTINLTAGLIEKTLADFGIPSKVVGFRVGPTVTQYAVEPGFIEKSNSDERQKIRISQISSLSRDLALALKAERLRIEAPVRGKSYVGIEVPNTKSSVVRLRSMLESEAFYRVNSPLAVPLGRDVSGQPLISDLSTMPHLLIAGTTGSGKSVCIAALTACLAMNNTPESLRMVMIDPKLVELMRFNGLPHLLGQVETEIERILGVLRWATSEMDYRYKILEKVKARNLDSYNLKMARANQPQLPRIVILIDELADLMMTAPDQTEHALVRLAQKSRGVGMHLVVATQRPSIDVVTGVIKANFPTRIAFTVASSIDSRVILDTNGAETLLGKGDLLFLHPEVGIPQRSQGVMVTDRELERIIKWWQVSISKKPLVQATEPPPWEETIKSDISENEDDELINNAIEIMKKDGRASASYLQRQLRIGYPRAARLIDQLEDMGIIGPSQGGGKEREILLRSDEEE